MRKSGIFTLLSVLAVILIFTIFISEPLVERQIESQGSRSHGAAVELEEFYLSLVSLNIGWSELIVGNPDNAWENLIQTGKTDFNLDLIPLLSKKAVVENMTVKDILSGRPRSEPGFIELERDTEKDPAPDTPITPEKESGADAGSTAAAEILNRMNQLNSDSLYEVLNLRTPEIYDSLNSHILNRKGHWEQIISELPEDDALDSLAAEARQLKMEDIHDLEDIQNAINTLKKLYDQTDSMRGHVKSLKKDFKQDMSDLNDCPEFLNDQFESDLQAVRDVTDLDAADIENIAGMIFGPEITSKITQAVTAVQKTRSILSRFSSKKPKKEKPGRLKGQTIYFSTPNSMKSLPRFWVKNVDISGTLNSIYDLSGKITDLVSDQNLINRPTRMHMEGMAAQTGEWFFNLLLDLRTQAQSDSLSFAVPAMDISGMSLENNDFIPYPVRSGKLAVTGDFIMKDLKITGSYGISGSNIEFVLPDPSAADKADMLKIRIAESLDQVRIQGSVSGQFPALKFTVESNIDNIIRNEVQSLAEAEMTALRSDLENRARAELTPYTGELNNLLASTEGDLFQLLDIQEGKYDDVLDEIKSRQKEYEDQLKDDAIQEIEDKLKNLFR